MASSMKEFEHLEIPLEEIKSATNNFNEENVIGHGGFGKVYKGERSHSQGKSLVAIKRLDCKHGQGDAEFYKEVRMLSCYRHENIISFLGFNSGRDEMILVYEYASRGSLDGHLKDITLTWTQRLKICLDAAKGLSYLHDPKKTYQRLIHCDIKSANILLDENFNAKIADFGLSKKGPANQQNSVLVTDILGTHGYCDPVFMETYTLTKESDVYSFGVVLFEVLCGRLCFTYSNGHVPFWKKMYKENKLNEIILKDLMQQMDRSALKTFAGIAYQCLERSREERPVMSLVVKKLQKSLKLQELYDSKLRRSEETLNAVNPFLRCRSIKELKALFAKRFLCCPGIDGFQIIGAAKPGGKLICCGYPVRGTSLCMFQWVRLLDDGTREYIDGAANPEYLVTADDVDTLIGVECIPMDDQGRQGELVGCFANKQNKITCDPKMQQEIDSYVSAGKASFSVLLRMGYFGNFERTTFTLSRSKYQIWINRTRKFVIDEKYSLDLSIKIPSGSSTQFELTRPNGSSYYFNTSQDFSIRDILVLTMRKFQKKVE